MSQAMHDLEVEGLQILALGPVELELRYSDWIAKVRLVLQEDAPEHEASLEEIDTKLRGSLRQRATELVSLLGKLTNEEESE